MVSIRTCVREGRGWWGLGWEGGKAGYGKARARWRGRWWYDVIGLLFWDAGWQ